MKTITLDDQQYDLLVKTLSFSVFEQQNLIDLRCEEWTKAELGHILKKLEIMLKRKQELLKVVQDAKKI